MSSCRVLCLPPEAGCLGMCLLSLYYLFLGPSWTRRYVSAGQEIQGTLSSPSAGCQQSTLANATIISVTNDLFFINDHVYSFSAIDSDSAPSGRDIANSLYYSLSSSLTSPLSVYYTVNTCCGRTLGHCQKTVGIRWRFSGFSEFPVV